MADPPAGKGLPAPHRSKDGNMAFSIVTNVASILAQDNLRITGELQQKTIQRLTSGLRINSSADDAAGLAIANSFRSDIAVLQQGIRNAGDGLSTLQTIDGGINNISLLLDRARTLAAQSASGTFTGDRSVLNSEFATTLGEIDRQAQAVGLNPGGTFVQALSVFIGGGRGTTSALTLINGSVSIDLTQSTISSGGLGLTGVQALGGATGSSGTDIGTASATSVNAIATNATNTASERVSGFTDFYFSGPGFGDTSEVRVSVNLTGVVDTTTLTTALNAAIDSAAAGVTPAAVAFKNAGIKAVINTDSTGKKQLTFTSSSTAFQVQAGDRLSNALLGNVTSSSDPTGLSLQVTRTAAAASAAGPADATANVVAFKISGGGLTTAQLVTINLTAAATTAAVLANLATTFAANTTLVAAGFTVTDTNGGALDTAGDQIRFNNNRGEKFEVAASGDNENLLGFGTAILGASNVATYTTLTAASAALPTNTNTGTISILVENAGGAVISIDAFGIAATGTAQQLADQLNSDIANSTTLTAAGIEVEISGASLLVKSNNGTRFQVTSAETANNVLGFGTVTASSISVGTLSTLPTELTFNPGGAQAISGNTSGTDPIAFTGLFYGNEVQNLVFSAKNDAGVVQSLSIQLTYANASTLDNAVNTLNTKLQESNNSTLQRIIVTKERLTASTEGIRFLSTLASFSVGVGDTPSGNGVSDSTPLLTSAALTGGSVSDISTSANAQTAVSNLSIAVSLLAAVQATVGKGQNQLQFAIGLAATQVNNISVAQGRIRDADLAAEAANLTRASISQQAGIAALAQANSAPQVVLALLRG